MSAHVAIDLGAESGRAIVGVLTEDRVALHEVHRFENRPCRLPTGLHWDVTGLWRELLEGLRRAVAHCAECDVRLESVGVDAWGVDYALLGASGELLGAPHAYRDERNAAAFRHAIATLGEDVLYDVTGIQFMEFNTLFQLVAQRDADRSLLDAAAHLLLIPDLFHFMLTGTPSNEATAASTTQMIDARTGRWATHLLDALALPTRMLGPIAPPGTRVGTINRAVAEATGADPGLAVIAPAAHDTASAIAAVPADPATRWAYLSSGTWSLLGAELAAPCLTPAARAVPFTNEGGVGGTIRFLKNITGLWLVQECRRDLASRGHVHDYPELTRLAGAAPPFRTLIDPAHPPFQSPGNMPAKIADYARRTGQPEPRDAGALVRCALESLALTYRRTLSLLERTLDASYDVLHVVGGGGRNTLLNQMTADATGRPVRVGPFEATATGNVLVQAMGTGTITDLAHARRVVRASSEPVLHEPRPTAAWEHARDRFEALLAAAPG